MYRRARFIWTPRQAIDHEAGFRSLLVHGARRRDDGVNRWYLFRRRFELPAPAQAAPLQIFADSRYLLYVNGRRVGRGPGRATPAFARVDRYEVAPLLNPGTNVLAVLVHVYGVDTAWYETSRDAAQSIFGDGGLYLHASIDCGSTRIELCSDALWRVTECRAWRRDAPRSGWGQGFIEDSDARLFPAGWYSPEFDDSHWDPARPLLREADEADLAKGWGDVEPFPTLLPREIPPLAERPCGAARMVAMHAVPSTSALPLERRIYEEPFAPLPDDAVEDPTACLAEDARSTWVRSGAHGDVSLLFEFERRHAGHPFIELEARGGEIIEVAAAETVLGEYRPAQHGTARVGRASHLDCAQLFRYTARPGLQRFEKFEWTGLKYLQVVVRNAPLGIGLRRIGSIETHYPVVNEGAFECSDELLTRLWQVGRYTALQCTHDGWEDCPGREKRQWLGDGAVHYLVDAAAFGCSTTPLARLFLLQATESQRADGLLQMFAPGDHQGGAVVIPDFSLHWICTAEHYLLHSGDLDTVIRLLPAVQRCLDWFARQCDLHGLLANLPHWHFIEWARVQRCGESFAINALLQGALQSAAALAGAVGYEALHQQYAAWAARLRTALRARHFDPQRRVFVDSVDPATGRQDPQVSQQANALAILFDVATPDEWPAIVERITDESRLRRTAVAPVTFAADPFDAATDVVRANTFFAHFLYSALGKAGRFDRALAQMRSLYGPMLATGTETLWESSEPVASLCHAFSASPVYQLGAQVLGVQPLAAGFARARVAPQWGDLAHASGRYPTPRGPIGVSWRRRDDGVIEVDLEIPAGIEVEFVAPADHRLADEKPTAALDPGRHLLTVHSRAVG